MSLLLAIALATTWAPVPGPNPILQPAPKPVLAQGTDGGPLQVTGADGAAVVVDGSGVVQPVSVAALPLPSGAAQDATLTGGGQQTKITDGTTSASVTAASTAAAATDKALVVAVSPNNSIAVTATQLPAALDGSGFLKIHEQGTLGVGGTQANNASITANPMLVGAEALVSTAAPGTVATSGNIRRAVSDTYGDQWVRDGSPNQIGLWIAALSTTLTQEVAAPAAATSIYVTDILCQSTTSTASTCQLKWGTGSNCGTGTVSGPIYVSPANTANPTEVHSPHYVVKVPAASALCVVCGSATNTCNVALGAYVAQ